MTSVPHYSPQVNAVTFAALLLALGPGAYAQVIEPGMLRSRGTPCCSVTAIDTKTSLVTVQQLKPEITFQFPAQIDVLRTFTLGQQVMTSAISQSINAYRIKWGMGDLPHCACGKMSDGTCWCSKHPGDPCFKIGCPYGVAPTDPTYERSASPCCKITAVDERMSLATVQQLTPHVTFQFPASSAALRTLKIGQQVTTSAISQSVQAYRIRWGMGDLPHCDCGKMSDGTCWCSKHPGDPCFKIGCPYGVAPTDPTPPTYEPTPGGPRRLSASLSGACGEVLVRFGPVAYALPAGYTERGISSIR